MYSRVAEVPLTTIATLASGTSTPSLRTRPVTSLVYVAGAEALQDLAALRQRRAVGDRRQQQPLG